MLFSRKKNKEPLEEAAAPTAEEPWRKQVIGVLSILFSIYGICTNSYVLISNLTKSIYFVALCLVLIFIKHPLKIGRHVTAASVIDVVLAAAGLTSSIYLASIMERLSLTNLEAQPLDFFAAAVIILLVIEATRRCVGVVMAALPVVFILYGLFGNLIPGIFGHYGFSWKRILIRLAMTSEGIYGSTTIVASSYIFLFIIFGAFLQQTGVGQFFTDLSNKIAGSSAGGPAKVATISSGLMGTISGSAAANVATTGAFTIPMMKKIGFKPEFAGAVEAVASTGGMIMPPIMGSAAFLMASNLSVTYGHIIEAAIIPAVLYYISCFCWVHFMAKRIGHVGTSRKDQPPIEDLGRRIWLLLPLAVIVASLLLGYTAILSAFFGMIATIVVGLIQRERLTFKKVLAALSAGSNGALSALIACVAAGIVVGICNMTSLGTTVTYNIVSLSGNNLFFALCLTAIASIILSMGLPATACYIVVATVIAPALIQMGAAPIAAHFFVFYFSCISNITPPVAIAAYTAAGIAQAKPFAVAVESMKIAAPGFIIPFMAVYSPIILGVDATLASIIGVLIASVIGVIFLAAAGAGYFRRHLSAIPRLLMGTGSLLLIEPTTLTDVVGILLIAGALLLCRLFPEKVIQPQAAKSRNDTIENI